MYSVIILLAIAGICVVLMSNINDLRPNEPIPETTPTEYPIGEDLGAVEGVLQTWDIAFDLKHKYGLQPAQVDAVLSRYACTTDTLEECVQHVLAK